MNKGLRISLISIFIVLMLACVGIDFWYLYIKKIAPEKVISHTFEVGLQSTTDGNTKHFMEVNMYDDLFEVKFNYMLDENKESFYSQGFQFYGPEVYFSLTSTNIEPKKVKTETEYLLIKHNYFNEYLRYDVDSAASSYYMLSEDSDFGVISSNPLSENFFFKIDLDNELYGMKLKGDETEMTNETFITSYVESPHAFEFRHYNCYMYYDMGYWLKSIYDSVNSFPNGTNSSYVFEFADLFNYYKYNSETKDYTDAVSLDAAESIKKAIKSYYSIKVIKNEGNIQHANQSLFKSVNGNTNFNLGGIESEDYFIGRTIIEARLNHFNSVKVTETEVALKLREDFIDCYTQDKYKDKIYLSVLIDLDKLAEDGKTFLGFTADSGLSNFTIISCQTVETIDGELVYSEVAYV